jgi:hypothetical protein
MPQTACSFTYFPPANSAALRGNSNVVKFSSKGGGGFIFIWNQLRPFIPIAGMKANGGGTAFEYLTAAQNVTNMPPLILTWFNSAFLASQNYATNNIILPDQIIENPANPNYFAGYLFKKCSDPFMRARYDYIANQVYNFWTNGDPAWTAVQQEAAINNFKTQMINNLADPNLYIAPANYDISGTSLFAIQLTAFKVAVAALNSFDAIEIGMP